ncbi:helix-turn-helix transcriptional regulator [Thalassotalea fusca]
MSKSTTVRHLEMLRKVPLYPAQPITTTALHQHLLDEGFQVSKRTVERDLIKLADIGGLYPESSAEGYRWGCIHKNDNKFKEIQPTEALMLVLSENIIGKAMPVEYSNRTEERLTDAKSMLNSGNALSKWKEKLQVISDGYPLIHNDNFISEKAREIIYDAVLKETQINITYQAKDKSTPISYCLNPLGIIIRGQSHYLVATKKNNPESPLLFLFHRIDTAENNYTEIDYPQSFTLKDYFSKNPSGWILNSDEKYETVKLKVKGFALDALRNNRLTEDQQLIETSSEWVEVSFTCIPTYDLIAWILRYGADIICEEPTELRLKISNVLNKTLEQYNV